jgi:hypothetical protein
MSLGQNLGRFQSSKKKIQLKASALKRAALDID